MPVIARLAMTEFKICGEQAKPDSVPISSESCVITPILGLAQNATL
jgi:hypothetical protein